MSGYQLDVAHDLIREMATRHYDVLVAIAMGGFVPAGVIARALEIPLATAITTRGYCGQERLKAVHITNLGHLANIARAPDGKARTVLLVDDICDSGATLSSVAEELLAAGAADVDACVVTERPGYRLSGVRTLFSLSVTEGGAWVTFPWEADGRLSLLGF